METTFVFTVGWRVFFILFGIPFLWLSGKAFMVILQEFHIQREEEYRKLAMNERNKEEGRGVG